MIRFILTIFLFVSVSFASWASLIGEKVDSVSKVRIINDRFNGFAINEKVEIGYDLPQDIHQKVENFVQGIGSPREQLNPYLEWEVRVYAEFQNLNTNEKITVEGFYYKEFESWSAKAIPAKSSFIYTAEDFRKLGAYKALETDKTFRIRFAAPSSGTWAATVFLMVDGEPYGSPSSINFTVNKSNAGEFISIADNKRFFVKGEKFFYPLGVNLPWPETDVATDPELAKNLCGYSDYDKRVLCTNEGYLNAYVAPRTYQKYRNLMVDLAKNGVNFLRTMMYPTGAEIEWEELGNYSKRLHMAQELDSILQTAEQSNIYILWNMQNHNTFQLSERAYYRSWTWNTKMNGYDFCYKKLLKSGNPIDFFTSAEAKRYYQQRIRYMIARWGYSSHILGFELFCEISNVGSSAADSNDFYRKDDNYKRYRDWQVEMANYIKSFYFGNRHLLSASYGGEKAPQDDTFHHKGFDIISSNIYDYQKPEFGSYYVQTVGAFLNDAEGKKRSWNSYVLNQNHSDQQDYHIRKPMIFSESDVLESLCDSTVIELRRAIWQSTFSGLAGSFSWELRFHKKYYSIYQEIGRLMAQFDLTRNGWHPGFMESLEGNWEFNQDFASKMNPKRKYPKVNGKIQGPADVIFLRAEDKNFAFGVITNKTYNIKSADTCLADNWSGDYEMLINPRAIDLKKEGPEVPGMNRGKYEIEYFYVSDPSKSVGYSTSKGPNLSFDFTIPANDFNYIIIFKAKKVGSNWSELHSKGKTTFKTAER